MKKIGDFLFVEQYFTDTEETKTAVVNINYIDSITQSCNDKLGDTEFENLISDEEEW